MHALTVEGVMRWYAQELGYGDDVDFWGLVGLLHDVDFEKYPDQHCKKAPELLAEIDADDAFIHAVVCHGYGICVDVAPEHLMEKVLYAADEPLEGGSSGRLPKCVRLRARKTWK